MTARGGGGGEGGAGGVSVVIKNPRFDLLFLLHSPGLKTDVPDVFLFVCFFSFNGRTTVGLV